MNENNEEMLKRTATKLIVEDPTNTIQIWNHENYLSKFFSMQIGQKTDLVKWTPYWQSDSNHDNNDGRGVGVDRYYGYASSHWWQWMEISDLIIMINAYLLSIGTCYLFVLERRARD